MEMSIRFPGLGLVFNYVPRSFQIFGMEFTIYGVLIAVGALLGMGLVTLEAKRNGEDQNRYLDMMLISLLVSVAGSRFHRKSVHRFLRGRSLAALPITWMEN